jgi:hypothetical protein
VVEKELRLTGEACMDGESVGPLKTLRKNALQLHREVDMSQLCIDWLATLTRYAVEVPMYSIKARSEDSRFCEGKTVTYPTRSSQQRKMSCLEKNVDHGAVR